MQDMQCTIHRFQGYTGYVLAGGKPGTTHELLAVRHSASVTPWADPDVHLHLASEEYYVLLQGSLLLLVAGQLVSLRPNEILMVRPGVPHAIVEGTGLIEHFGFRAPAVGDRQIVGEKPQQLPARAEEAKRELCCDWGFRIPLGEVKNQNCWLVGFGTARFPSSHLILAYLSFPTFESANAGIGTRHRLHLHQESWEYYLVLEGCKTLQIEDGLVEINAGEMVEVLPGVKHTLVSRQAPYRGFTLRVPALSDKVEF
jgi:mannose-6-phosphate isomerase-like protein (cupin superfamily)